MKDSASNQVVRPGVIPHQQGNEQLPFVFSKYVILLLESSPGGVGIFVKLGGVKVGAIVGIIINVFVGMRVMVDAGKVTVLLI
jgi:hypothetical protein